MRRKQRNRKEEEEALPKATAVQKVSRLLDVPQSTFRADCHLEMTSNTEAIVEGCSGVLEYNDEVIRLNGGKMVIKITGRNLQIRCMTGESAIVEGFILSIEFLC